MNKKTFSIILPVFKQVHLTKACLESIVKNTTPPWEVLVFNNGDDFKTNGLIKKLANPNIRVLSSEKNQGFISPCNACAKEAKGDILCVLNNDVIVPERWNESYINILQDKTIALTGPSGMGLSRACHAAVAVEPEYIEGWCLILRRDIYEKFGLFDPLMKFAFCEDTELGIRVRLAGFKIRVHHIPFVHHHAQTRKTLQMNWVAMEEENRKYLIKKYREYFSKKG